MEKSKFIEEKIDLLTQFWFGWACFFGALFFILLSLMDYVATPKNFPDFIYYRIAGAMGLGIVFLLNRQKLNRRYQLFLLYLATVFPTGIIEYMVLHFGGHTSTYYAGFFIFVMVVVGFIPIELRHSVNISLTAFSIFLIPILIFDKSLDPRYFIMPLSFLVSTFFIANVWRYLSQKNLVNQLSLQYDLDQQKKQLESYSLQLKDMVEERTKQLHESEQWHRSLFENATDGIIVLDQNGIILNVNDKACELHGFSRDALMGTHIRLLESSESRDKMAERMRRIFDGESLVYEAKHNMKDGTSIHLEISSKAIKIGDAVYLQSFYRDITEKKKMQQHLFQSQKMESIGVLAGGIAHDFNNILAAILGHAEIIRRTSTLDAKSVRSLSVIEDASRRAGRMITKLLGFARKSKYEMTPINVNDVVYDSVKLLEQVVDKNINLSVELANPLPTIMGDANQMEQVIMNFIVNARDSMPKGGRIVIKTSARTVSKGTLDVPPYVQSGDYVLLSVSDTGMGIPEELINKIFEPFFTTKDQGKGTGLGLSMVYGAVKDHEGYLSVQSTVGTGSVFTVYLPVAKAAASLMSKAPAKGKETLLVVDDEESLLDVMREALEGNGYKVFATSESTVALDIYRRIFHDIALVITDIVMPQMDGKELIHQIKEINPAVKVLAVSGYTKYVAGKEEIRDIEGFLHKPFESYYLLSVVRRILDARPKSIDSPL
jgi:PAS domain S-box-containing protein